MSTAPETTLVLVQQFPWLRLAPPILAIVLAVACKDVNLALLIATSIGCLLFCDFHVVASIDQLCDVLVHQLASADHASVILFTVLLGAMICLMNDSGGTTAVVDRLTGVANTRRKGQVLTWLAGMLIFFDDYANTMLIGGSARPLCDRLKISRAKLAFLIDATAAPMAGLALSTWTAFEIDQVTAGLAAADIDASAGAIFFATIPYRIYPVLAIMAVACIAVSGRDFGPMLQAEREAQASTVRAGETPTNVSPAGSIWFAILPVIVLIGIVIVGYLYDIDAYRLLLTASLAAATTAALVPLATRSISLHDCSASWVRGISSMLPAIIILCLAWSISDICQPEKLDTAGYISSLVGNSLPAVYLPAVAFMTAGAIAVCIGSSFTTMSLLLPMFIPLAWNLLASETATPSVESPIFLATIGAILAGAIFGDHCSPISDTTVLSSAAAGCDHLQHVSTQLPYAMVVASCSLLLGYLPIGFGVPWTICLPLSAAVCVAIILWLGRKPNQQEGSSRRKEFAKTLVGSLS